MCNMEIDKSKQFSNCRPNYYNMLGHLQRIFEERDLVKDSCAFKPFKVKIFKFRESFANTFLVEFGRHKMD